MGSTAYGLVVVAIGVLLLQAGCAYEHAYPRTDSGAFEIKELSPTRVLLTRSEEPYFERSNELFGRLFSYIDTHDVPMTVPVEMRQEPGTMIFFVGSEVNKVELESSGAVVVENFPARTVASHGARGSYTAENFQEAATRLNEWLDKQSEYVPAGTPYAVYWHGPFMPGFLKRYEVHVPVQKQQKSWMGTDIWVHRPQSQEDTLDLDEFRWENRLLVVFVSDDGTPELDEFGSSLEAEADGVQDRDLLMIPVLNSENNPKKNVTWQNAQAIRERYSVGRRSFLVVLVGKDGTEKRRWSEVPPLDEIFEIIDAMPMRRREMRERGR